MDSFPFNLLLFPLVGGYYIVTRLESFKYLHQRWDNQATLFNSILVGIPVLFGSLLITGIIEHYNPEWVGRVKQYFPVQDSYFGTCIVAFLIAVGGTMFCNLIIKKSKAIEKAIERVGNELEVLFAKSFIESALLQLTLKNDKVYIGWVEIIPEPSRCPYVKFIPLFSGFRDEKKELHITTSYSDVYASYLKKGKIKEIDELEMNLVIQVSEIISASRFDFDIFEEFELSKAGLKNSQK